VRLTLTGPAILAGVCYCDDCQAAARRMQADGASPDVHDAWGGTGYVTLRDDRLIVSQGADRLTPLKLGDGAPTTRFVATCCNCPVYLKYAPGWWTSVYRARLGPDAPANEMRSQTRYAEAQSLPDDLPAYRGIPLRLFGRLLMARLAMWLRPGA
jgi:hypothetical protein